ncbi:hypothetical protein Nmel_017869, partial [Mimus melanotis]
MFIIFTKNNCKHFFYISVRTLFLQFHTSMNLCDVEYCSLPVFCVAQMSFDPNLLHNNGHN